MSKFQQLEDNFESGMEHPEISVRKNLTVVDRTALKELLGAYGMFKSDKQQEALKTNSSLQAYGDAVETMMDALGIDEEFLRNILDQYDQPERKRKEELQSKFKIVGKFTRPSHQTRNGKKCRELGFTVVVSEDDEYPLIECMEFLDIIQGK